MIKLLAHYTIFGDKIYNLNTFSLEGNKITFKPVTAETAHTIFIEGLLIISKIDYESSSDLNKFIQSCNTENLKKLAEQIATYLKNENAQYQEGEQFHLLTVTYPDFNISEIKPRLN